MSIEPVVGAGSKTDGDTAECDGTGSDGSVSGSTDAGHGGGSESCIGQEWARLEGCRKSGRDETKKSGCSGWRSLRQMVVPAWGKGNAHNAPGSSDKFVELSRKSAQAHAAASAAMDSEKDSKILDRINVSALDSDRKTHALKNTRAALRLAQRGVDPLTDSTFQSCDVCRSKPGARVHLFLCSQRERKPKGVEKDIQLRAFQDIAHYLAECRQILSQQVRTHLHAPTIHARLPLGYVRRLIVLDAVAVLFAGAAC